MELKHHLDIDKHPKVFTFNRTTMELKPDEKRRPNPAHVAFNRTTMELKRRFAWLSDSWKCDF